jgi:hypothetical protein
MPVWLWVLLGLTALGFVLWLLEDATGLDVIERFGKALAILFILAVLGGLIFSFVNADWR